MEILANGDVLAVWFSSAVGPGSGEPGDESSINARMVQARFRHGADRWDTPALFYDWKYLPTLLLRPTSHCRICYNVHS